MKLLVCTEGKKCPKRGSGDVLSRLKRLVTKCDLDDQIAVRKGGCFGLCGRGSVVLLKSEGLCYGYVSDSDCKDIVKSLRKKCNPVERLMIKKSGKKAKKK